MIRVYRLAAAGDYDELDLTGAAAKAFGGRWNNAGTPMIYAASSIALAALETIVHFGMQSAPWNRYVIAIDIPAAHFTRRDVLNPPPPDSWDSVPASFKSRALGSEWVEKKSRLVLDVPSVVVPQERNYLLNPLNKGIAKVKATNLGRFSYDPRLRPARASRKTA